MPVTAFTVHSDFNVPIISPSASPLPKTTPHRWERTWKRLKMSSALLFQKVANLFSRKASVPAKRGCCASVPTVAWPWDRLVLGYRVCSLRRDWPWKRRSHMPCKIRLARDGPFTPPQNVNGSLIRMWNSIVKLYKVSLLKVSHGINCHKRKIFQIIT